MAKKKVTTQKAKSDTTKITTAYKVDRSELVFANFGKRDIYRSDIADSTKAKMAANQKHINTTIKRNMERTNEGKSMIPSKANPRTLVQGKGTTFKKTPIKATPKKK